MTSSRFTYLTIATVLGAVFLAALGAWQLQRMAWKGELLDALNSRAAAQPVDLSAFMRRWNAAAASEDLRFVRVSATGRYHHGRETPSLHDLERQSGWRIVTPLETGDG